MPYKIGGKGKEGAPNWKQKQTWTREIAGYFFLLH
jgi:hypothetical protein